jgi:hypothetical protein
MAKRKPVKKNTRKKQQSPSMNKAIRPPKKDGTLGNDYSGY